MSHTHSSATVSTAAGQPGWSVSQPVSSIQTVVGRLNLTIDTQTHRRSVTLDRVFESVMTTEANTRETATTEIHVKIQSEQQQQQQQQRRREPISQSRGQV